MEINFNINLTKKQKEAYQILHDKETQILVARWSRQCGKTVFAEIMMIEYLCKPNTFNAYISPSFAQGKKVFAELMKLLDGTNLIKKANASDLIIESTLGSTLKFFSMESPTSIRGNTVSGILVLDELAFFPTQLSTGEDPWYNVILPIIKARKPKVLAVSTPNGKQGTFFDLYNKAASGEKGYKELTATIYDDELMSEEEIEELKRGYPKLAFDQEFLCQFLSNALTVFPDFEDCFDIDEWTNGKCWAGLDPSSTEGNDNTILTLVNERNEIRQFNISGSLDSKYNQISNIINKYNPISTYIENNSIGEVMYNEIRKQLVKKSAFHTFTTTNDSKKDYISLIMVAVANRSIHMEKSNALLRSEMSTFTYKLTKTGRVTYAARDGFHDDTVTSLGIALQCKEDYKFDNNISKSNFVALRQKMYY